MAVIASGHKAPETICGQSALAGRGSPPTHQMSHPVLLQNLYRSACSVMMNNTAAWKGSGITTIQSIGCENALALCAE